MIWIGLWITLGITLGITFGALMNVVVLSKGFMGFTLSVVGLNSFAI